MNFICKHCGADHAENTCKAVIKFPCKVKFTIHTYSGTARTAVYKCRDKEHLEWHLDQLLSDTSGQTKSVTHSVYEAPKS